MATNAERDGNFVPSILGVSSADGVTATTIYVNPTTHRVLVDNGGGSSGISSINGDTTSAQTLNTGTTGTDFNIVDDGMGTHTFEIPNASASARGLLTSADWTTFNNKGTGNGTVTSIAVASSNGFSGSSSGGATPTLTIATSVNGITKGNGSALSAATAGTDYTSPTGAENLANKSCSNMTIQDQSNLMIVNSGDSSQKLEFFVNTGFNNTATWTVSNNSGTVIIDTAVQTMTNKTLTAPKIATISNTGTLTLPTSTDTLIGKATTDTLTNKTFDTAGTGNSFSINGVAVTANTGTGSVVRATSPTLVTPALGTPTSGTLTNATGLPISTGVSGLGTGVATFLATPSSANLASAVTDETGTGKLVFASKPTFIGTVQTVTAMGAQAIDGSTANIFTRTLAASETFTQSNFSTGQCFMVEVTQGSGTTYTVTWFSGITWVTSGGTAPVQTTTSNGITTYGFRCTGSNTFLGYLVGTN